MYRRPSFTKRQTGRLPPTFCRFTLLSHGPSGIRLTFNKGSDFTPFNNLILPSNSSVNMGSVKNAASAAMPLQGLRPK